MQMQTVFPWASDLDLIVSAAALDRWKRWAWILEKNGFIVFQEEYYPTLRICKRTTAPTPFKAFAPWALCEERGSDKICPKPARREDPYAPFPYIDLYRLVEEDTERYAIANDNLLRHAHSHRYARSDLFPLKRCRVAHLADLPCPARADALLRKCYGADYRTTKRPPGWRD